MGTLDVYSIFEFEFRALDCNVIRTRLSTEQQAALA